MKSVHISKTLRLAAIAAAPFVGSTVAHAQGGYGMGAGMMGGYGEWMGGGHGGIWLLVLLVAVVAGLVGWLIAKKRK